MFTWGGPWWAVQAKAVKKLLAYRLPDICSKARAEWFQVVEGDHPLWEGVSSEYKAVIRSFLVHFYSHILSLPTPDFSFCNGSVGDLPSPLVGHDAQGGCELPGGAGNDPGGTGNIPGESGVTLQWWEAGRGWQLFSTIYPLKNKPYVSPFKWGSCDSRGPPSPGGGASSVVGNGLRMPF